jgi:hypothetical protein
VCTGNQKRPRIDGVLQPRLEHCPTCVKNPLCSEDGCISHVPSGGKVPRRKATWSPNGRCVRHMRATNSSCQWGTCGNRSSGCNRLSVEFDTGKCYACKQGYLPCVNAVHSCPSHARPEQPSMALRECAGADNQPCPFRATSVPSSATLASSA